MDELISIYYGTAHSAEARIYAEYDGDIPPGARLTGTIRGPSCRYADTLPTTTRLRHCGPGATLLSQAIVIDPCFWTPQLPFCYQVAVQLRQGDCVLAQSEWTVGIRPLGIIGNHLVLAGKRWVPRGIANRSIIERGITACHDTATSVVVADPSGELLSEATRCGVLLIAILTGREAADTLQRLSRWPAVAIVLFEENMPNTLRQRNPPKNILLGQYFSPGKPVNLTPWSQLALVEAPSAEQLAERTKGCLFPVLTYRPHRGEQLPRMEVAQLRAACDRLQRDLAAHGDFAGYIV